MKRIRTQLIAIFAVGAWALQGCQSSKETPAPPGAPPAPPTGGSPGGRESALDENHELAEPLNLKNLTVWALLAKEIAELGEFLSLKEAQDRGVAVIGEMGSGTATPSSPVTASSGQAHGSAPAQARPGAQADRVNALRIENKGDLPILICAGTVVKGGNQDRQIGEDLVIAPRTSVPVGAFCIEAHRWTPSREGSQTLGLFKCQEVVTASQVRYSAQYFGDQNSVWKSVDHLNSVAGKSPSTATFLATIEETDKEAIAVREELRAAVASYFKDLRAKGKAPVGFAYAVNGKPIGVRAFAHPRLFEGQLEFFVKAMCMEADLAQREARANGKEAPSAPASSKDIVEMVQRINREEEKVSSTPGANRNGFRRSSFGGNSNCYLEIPRTREASPGRLEKALVPITRDWTATAKEE